MKQFKPSDPFWPRPMLCLGQSTIARHLFCSVLGQHYQRESEKSTAIAALIQIANSEPLDLVAGPQARRVHSVEWTAFDGPYLSSASLLGGLLLPERSGYRKKRTKNLSSILIPHFIIENRIKFGIVENRNESGINRCTKTKREQKYYAETYNSI